MLLCCLTVLLGVLFASAWNASEQTYGEVVMYVEFCGKSIQT